MLERLQILDWVVEVDRAATEAAYSQQEPNYPASCKCLYCDNFAAAISLLPPEFLNLCGKLSIDPTKPSEVYELTRLDTSPSMHLYGGWYHVVGQIVEKSEGTETSHIDSSGAITYTELTSDWGILISNNDALLPSGFPTPYFALEVSGNVPWVLDEQP